MISAWQTDTEENIRSGLYRSIFIQKVHSARKQPSVWDVFCFWHTANTVCHFVYSVNLCNLRASFKTMVFHLVLLLPQWVASPRNTAEKRADFDVYGWVKKKKKRSGTAALNDSYVVVISVWAGVPLFAPRCFLFLTFAIPLPRPTSASCRSRTDAVRRPCCRAARWRIQDTLCAYEQPACLDCIYILRCKTNYAKPMCQDIVC